MALLGERVRSSRATSSRATAPGTGPGGGRGSANGPVGTSARRPSRLPGLALAALGVVAASAVHLLVPAVPMLTAAVVLGIAAAHLPGIRGLVHGLARPGLTLAGKRLMRLGIVLLGLKLGLSDVLGLGWATVAMVAGVVTATFFGTVWLGRKLGLSGDQPVLIATGYSICGASAIGAVSDVRGSEERDVATSVALVTLCGTLAIAALPLLHQPLGLDDGQFGRWVGAGVHDVGQVVATAQTAGPDALGQAVLVKLVRVMALAPLVAAMVVAVRRRGSADAVPGQKRPPLVPLFVLGFLAMVALRTTGRLPGTALDGAAWVQEVLLAAALFGLGSAVHLPSLARTGGRVAALGLCSWIVIAAASYGGVLLTT
ncbi:putative sulfate exporter family transporter [Streptomyces sp. NBC_01795]|uniref:YeiH family protein n=1 Tax=unclassified Streptomyces TaxID=2593676 RepID=UPI002DDA37A9|nr:MULTISPECIES: putative sulfate exporter family transporter [unclassified Streptomyces]WSA94462.1 putative sulfate exporter family transporter [Streptomyces sp. NBC_01795]WSB78881.1 putative sulfate exporter family transporter [Streptomyces sp. NBC_01775]WSS12917.1 putative sulfate exporter family transporter [Streptomyces sp. NBC_01186]